MFVDSEGWHWHPPSKKVNGSIVTLKYTIIKGSMNYIAQVEVIQDCMWILLIIGDYKRVLWADHGPYSGSRDALRVQLRESFMSFLSKLPDNSAQKSLLSVQVDEGLSKKHPALYEYLTAATYPDGTVRETSTLSISVADDGYKFCLRDRDQARCLWITSHTFFDGLKALDSALRGIEAPWVKDRFSLNGAAGNGNKKKK